MSQIFDALQRAGTELPALDPTSGPASDFDATAVDRVPSFSLSARPERRLVTLTEERSVGSEKIRMLGARLRQLQKQRAIKTLLVTSSIKDEGKSLLAANLAFALAKTKQRVLLIDGDCHRGSLAGLLGTGESLGLMSWWRSRDPIVTYLRQVNGVPVWFLPAGEPSAHAVEMLQSPRFSEMLSLAAGWFDWVIVDSPPLAPIADSAIWVSLTDATLLVVRAGKTPRKLLGKVLDSLDTRKLLGIVLNESSDPQVKHYAAYYGTVPAASDKQARK